MKEIFFLCSLLIISFVTANKTDVAEENLEKRYRRCKNINSRVKLQTYDLERVMGNIYEIHSMQSEVNENVKSACKVKMVESAKIEMVLLKNSKDSCVNEEWIKNFDAMEDYREDEKTKLSTGLEPKSYKKFVEIANDRLKNCTKVLEICTENWKTYSQQILTEQEKKLKECLSRKSNINSRIYYENVKEIFLGSNAKARAENVTTLKTEVRGELSKKYNPEKIMTKIMREIEKIYDNSTIDKQRMITCSKNLDNFVYESTSSIQLEKEDCISKVWYDTTTEIAVFNQYQKKESLESYSIEGMIIINQEKMEKRKKILEKAVEKLDQCVEDSNDTLEQALIQAIREFHHCSNHPIAAISKSTSWRNFLRFMGLMLWTDQLIFTFDYRNLESLQ